MRIKRTDTVRVGKEYVLINREYCLFHALGFDEYCQEKCADKTEGFQCAANCNVYQFLEFAENKLGMCAKKAPVFRTGKNKRPFKQTGVNWRNTK